MYIISACLLGETCKYNGGHNDCAAVHEWIETESYLTVCPEVAGGLPVPRPPAELLQRSEGPVVMNREGENVTEAFVRGAEREWERIQKEAVRRGEVIQGAILKKRSPSCGSGTIYDGTFTKKEIRGDGIFAALLKQNGIRVMTEEEWNNDRF